MQAPRRFSFAVSALFAALFVGSVLYQPSCSTIKHIVSDVNNPDTTAGAVVADCVKPEIADQIANLLASVNQILVDPSKTTAVKEAEINALRAGKNEVLACALREGVSEITRMVLNAANKHAQIDPRLFDSRATMSKLIQVNGYRYADGWGSSGADGGTSSDAGAGGRASASDGGAGGTGR